MYLLIHIGIHGYLYIIFSILTLTAQTDDEVYRDGISITTDVTKLSFNIRKLT